jgi:pimeloyl-ACP methyl ester carboxylesterase
LNGAPPEAQHGGMKPPIVLVHGACSQPPHLEAWREFFQAAGYVCLAPALPAHAPGEFDALRRLGIGDYRDSVANVVGRLERPPVVIGHSMGGLLAKMIAARSACAGIVLVASVPSGYLPATWRAVPDFVTVAPRILAGLPFRPTPSGLKRLTLHHLDRNEQDALVQNFVAESGRAYRQMVFGLARISARRVNCPVLVVHGDADRLVPLAVGRRIARRHAAELITIAGHGHWLIAPSLTERVAGAILGWIERLPDAHRPSLD